MDEKKRVMEHSLSCIHRDGSLHFCLFSVASPRLLWQGVQFSFIRYGFAERFAGEVMVARLGVLGRIAARHQKRRLVVSR